MKKWIKLGLVIQASAVAIATALLVNNAVSTSDDWIIRVIITAWLILSAYFFGHTIATLRHIKALEEIIKELREPMKTNGR